MNRVASGLAWLGRLGVRGKGPVLIQRNMFYQSQESDLFLDKGSLELRNSDTLELKLYRINQKNINLQPASLQINAKANLKELSEAIEREFPISNLKFYSEENVPFSLMTPLDAFLNRYFTIISPEYKIRIEGQFLHPDLSLAKQNWKSELRESLKQVELPIFVQREIEGYLHRVQTWLDAKYGLNSPNAKLKANQVKDILVQALRDPDSLWTSTHDLEAEWRAAYFELQQLKKKYSKAVEVSTKMARNRMYFDLLLLCSNVCFIGGGTYVVYSWDIIEPWAYFISSFASIYLFRKAAKFRKPFSLDNYKNYLVYEVYLQKAAGQVGLDLSQFSRKQKGLQMLQTTFKDELIAKL